MLHIIYSFLIVCRQEAKIGFLFKFAYNPTILDA